MGQPPVVRSRDIWQLAWPALAALLAQPVFLLIDTAIIGQLGVPQLAGVAVAATVLSTVVGLTIFLAYGATATVARLYGAGQLPRALGVGMDSIYLAVIIGLGLSAVLAVVGPTVIGYVGANAQARPPGTSYLLWSLPGLPAMLVVLAATGLLRGLQDTRTPMWVAGGGAVLNIGLSLLLVLGLRMGVAGSALGTSLTQTIMAGVLMTVVLRQVRAHQARWRPHLGGIIGVGGSGLPLFLRTLALRIALVATTMAAAQLGQVTLAGHQVISAIWNFLALGLDALAIAAQALIGRALGANAAVTARSLGRLALRWSLAVGALLGVLLLVVSPVVGALFTPDPPVRQAIGMTVIVLAAAQILAGYVFCLDGILIGAGDGRYLARAGWAALAAYLPVLWAVVTFVPAGPAGPAGLVYLWLGYVFGYLAARALSLWLRYRRDSWLVTGA